MGASTPLSMMCLPIHLVGWCHAQEDRYGMLLVITGEVSAITVATVEKHALRDSFKIHV